MLPKKIIGGQSVRDYAYNWIVGGCLIHQWCSGGRGIDAEVVAFAEHELNKIKGAVNLPDVRSRMGWNQKDVKEFGELVEYLKANLGAPKEKYIPDQWTR